MSTAVDRVDLLELDEVPSKVPTRGPRPLAAPAPVAPVAAPAPAVEPAPAPTPAPIVEAAPAPVAPAPMPAPAPPSPVALPAHAPVRMASNAEIAARNATAPESAAPAPIPGASTASIGDALGTAVAEGQRLHAQRNHVRGGVLRPDVNRVAGYNTAVVAQRGEATRYSDAARNAQLDPTAAPLATNTGHLTAGDVVAGATKVREGALVGWAGKGARTRGQIVDALAAAGLPTEWAPKAKSAHAHAGVLLNGISRDGLIARSVEAAGKTPEQRGWQAVWNVGRVGALGSAPSVPSEAVGRPFGAVAMVVTLSNGGSLTVDIGSNADLADMKASLVARFNARCAEEHYTAGDVTAWLGSVMRTRLGGIAYGPGTYYVQAANAERAERLCETMKAAGWGMSWIVPALPIVNGDRLKTALVSGLVEEARAVLVDYAEARDAAAKEGKAEIGTKKALNLRADMTEVLERAKGYAAMLGEAAVKNLRAAVRAAVEEIEPTLSHEAIRFSQIWDDLRASGEVSDAIPEPIADVSPTAATVAVEAPAPAPIPVAVPTERAIVNPTERGPRRPARSVASTIAAAPLTSSIPATMVDGVPLAVAVAPVALATVAAPAVAPQRRTDPAVEIRRGRLVRVVRGRKVALGTEGAVVRYEQGNFGMRVTIKVAGGKYEQTAANNVECVVDDNGQALYPSL